MTHFIIVNNNMISLDLFVVEDKLTTKQRIKRTMDHELTLGKIK
jgi:hypothetical protein